MLGLARGLTVVLATTVLSTKALAQQERIAPLGFEVSTKDLTQCGNVVIQWQNGNPPLYLTVIVSVLTLLRSHQPAYHVATNISIPETTQNSTGGKFSFALPYPESTNLTFILSDQDGFAVSAVKRLTADVRLAVCQRYIKSESRSTATSATWSAPGPPSSST